MNLLMRLIEVSIVVSSLSVSASAFSTRTRSQVPLIGGEKQQWGNERYPMKFTGRGLLRLQTPNGETDELLRSAAASFRAGKFDEAIASLQKAAILSPNDFRPQALMGYVYSFQNKMKSASEAYAAAIKLQPNRKELYLAKADVDRSRNAHEDAIEACRKAIEVDPNFAEAYAMLGDMLRWDEKRRPEAIAALRSAIKINPALQAPYDDLGSIFESANADKDAEEVFRQGMASDPRHMAGRFALGRLMVKQGRLAEARALWDGRTTDQDLTHPQFIELLKRAEDLKAATETLARKPKDADALIDMGVAVMDGPSWVVDGRQKRAIVYFQQALEQKPNYARAQYYICKAYVQIADTFSKEKNVLDVELGKLRALDPKLADELEQYKKSYHGAIVGPRVSNNQ